MKMEQRRRLTDLYTRGEEVPITGADGEDPIKVWVRKMTPADAEISYLKASAKRASVLSMGKEEEPSEAYIALRAEIDQFSKENLVVWCVATEMIERGPEIEARIAFEEEWADENYLMSLQERASQGDFQTKAEELPTDPEVIRVNSELERYNAQIQADREKIEKATTHEFELKSEKELQNRVLEAMLSSQADSTWLLEFQKCQVWRCIFDADNHKQRMFDQREEVDELQVEVLQQLTAAIDRVHVSDKEGKG